MKVRLNLSLKKNGSIKGGKWLNDSSLNITWNRVCMDWVEGPQNFNGFMEFCSLQGSHLDNIPLRTLKPDWQHREHTLLLNRKRVNKGMKRTNSLSLTPVVLTRPYCRENRYLQVLRSTVALNSYLGFSALWKFFFCFMYKIWRILYIKQKFQAYTRLRFQT